MSAVVAVAILSVASSASAKDARIAGDKVVVGNDLKTFLVFGKSFQIRSRVYGIIRCAGKKAMYCECYDTTSSVQ